MKVLRPGSKIRRALRGHSRGITMVEVLIAIAILGIISIAFLGAMSTTSMVLIVADERTTAESLARTQMESVKSQGYKHEWELGEPVYQRIGNIPEGYSIWSVNRAGETVDEIRGIPWNSEENKPAETDTGIQKVALVVKYHDKVVYTFIADNPYWADGEIKITLEGYKVDR